MNHSAQRVQSVARFDSTTWPIQICLLGSFRLLQAGHAVSIQAGGKIEALLCHLALQGGQALPRAVLINLLWPASDIAQGGQSLNTLVYSVHKLIGAALGGAAPVLHTEGCYRLNVENGIGVDVTAFEAWAAAGDQLLHAGDTQQAAESYRQSIALYDGDLYYATDAEHMLERERLRMRFLSLLAHLADEHFRVADYARCLTYAWRLLGHDPCREDAHRVVMRCLVRSGERAAALRHYGVCERILHTEFDAVPEPATTVLFDQIRLYPNQV